MLLWRRVSACCPRYHSQKERCGRCPGTFSQSVLYNVKREKGREAASLFVCFDCDSLSEELEGRRERFAREDLCGWFVC